MRNLKETGQTTDVIVVGGGVIGLAIARELGGRGLSVVVVERGRAGAEASHAAAGMLAPQSEADGDDAFFRLQCASRDLYPSFAVALAEESGIDVELDRTGTLYLALDAHDEAELERRFAWQKRAGLAVERLTTEEARLREPHVSPETRLALRFPSDWQVENRRLVAALVASVDARGGRTLTCTEAHSLRVEGGRATGVETSRGFLSAGAVVVAAGAWSSLLPMSSDASQVASACDIQRDKRAGFDLASNSRATGTEHPRIEPVRGQMLCFEARPALVGHVVYSPRGYIVPRRDGRLLAGSTTEDAGYERRVTAAGVHAMAAHALEIAPAVGGLPFIEAWAGLRPRAEDEWPVVGASAGVRGLIYATGHYRNGILLAPLTGEAVAEIVTGDTRPTYRLEAFSPERFRRLAVGNA